MNRTLLIDADDTLWENNIYFDQVISEFLDRLAEYAVDAQDAQQLLWKTEQHNVRTTGYGSRAFCQSLDQVARALRVSGLEPWIAHKEHWIYHHPIELMPGVRETLPRLQAKNHLILFTKGREEEQRGKLNRSGLADFFPETEIVFEKTTDSYRSVLRKYRLSAESTWMIGNSPRSDINPAAAAGLRTVFIPYHTTWQHELEEISHNGEIMVLESFGELAKHFG